jgi:glycerol uptake operon antiterminator
MSKHIPGGRQVSPIIPAVREQKELPLALAAPHSTIFLLSSNLTSIAEVVSSIKARGKEVYVHFDLVDGLGKDPHGLRWLAENVRPTGILTTRGPLVSQARSLGLATVQRIFLVDSQSLQTGLNLVREVKPDFVEVMPGLMPEVIRQIAQKVACPVIAGGLCTTAAHCRAAWEAGAVAVSTSDRELWKLSNR